MIICTWLRFTLLSGSSWKLKLKRSPQKKEKEEEEELLSSLLLLLIKIPSVSIIELQY